MIFPSDSCSFLVGLEDGLFSAFYVWAEIEDSPRAIGWNQTDLGLLILNECERFCQMRKV